MFAWMPKYNAFSGYVNASTVFYYHPREGNVFTCVCDSVHGGRCLVPGGSAPGGVPAPGWVSAPGGGAWSQQVEVPGPRGGACCRGGAWWRPPRRLLLRAVRILLECILVA